MARSTITSKNQTTVPLEVRKRLGVGPADTLIWEVVNNAVQVTVGTSAFLRHRGAVRVGAGSVADDVGKARELRGVERW